MEYKNLDLQNLDKLQDTLSSCDFLKEFKIKSQDNSKTAYELIPLQGKTGLINIFHNKNGKITLGISQGGNPDLSAKIAEIIVEKHKADVSAVLGTLTLSNFSEKNFNLIIGYFKEEKNCKLTLTEHDNPKSIQAKLENKNGQCNITFYFNGTLIIQGKPNILKLEISQTISILCPEHSDELIESEVNFFKITMLEDDIDSQTRKLLPNSYDYLKGKLIDYLKQAVVLSRIQLPTLPDYSCKVDTVFVVIEGILKRILTEELHITFDNFGDVFEKRENEHRFKLAEKHIKIVNSKILADRLETLYTLFNNRRHSLLHFKLPTETKPLIQSEVEANLLFSKCMLLIDETIKTFLEEK